MIPAKSTSDQRTYSSMTKGAGMPRKVEVPRGRRKSAAPAPASRRAGLPVPVVFLAHAVGLQAAPQRGTADAQPPRRFGQFPVRGLERVQNRLPLALGEGTRPFGARRNER